MAQDPSLAFAQNLVNRYMQFKAQQFQVELFKRREQRYERQLQENLTYRGERLGQFERRLDQQEKIAARPRAGTKPFFLERGYSEEEAQLAQDRHYRMAPGPMSPSQQMLAGKLMMSQARTNEERDAASAIIKDAGEAMMKQRQVPSASMFPQGPEEPSAFTPPRLGDKIAFPKAGPEMLAAAEIVTGKTKDPVGTAIGKVLGMKWSFEETTEMIRKLRAGGFIRMIHPDSEIGEVEVPVEEVANALEQNYQIVRD